MKLTITIPLEGNDLEENDFETFVKEALHDSACLHIEVARPLSETESHIVRSFDLSATCFGVDLALESEEK